MTTHTINSDQSFHLFTSALWEDYQKHRYLRVSVQTGKHRKLTQNATINMMYAQIGRKSDNFDVTAAKAHCKLHYGVPILRADSDEYREQYDKHVRGFSYEQKLQFMVEPFDFPVTRIMRTPQASEYIDTILMQFAQQGVILEINRDGE